MARTPTTRGLPDAGPSISRRLPYLVSPAASSGDILDAILTRWCADLPVGAPCPPQAPLSPAAIEEIRRALTGLGTL
jgi:hypothetical protein